jgi:type IV pilus assembly protein PilP
MTVPMNRMKKVVLAAIVSVAMAAVFSCKEEAPPAPKPQVVNKKIAIQKPKPAEAPPTVPAKSQAAAPQPEKPMAPAGPKQAAPEGADSGGDQPVSDLIKETRSIAVGYNPIGRIDPFEPLFRDESTADVASLSKGKHKKRTPQTPLERVAISQLKLSAIMRTAKGNRALVEDASGKGYVIKKGTYIGLNSGQVIKIDKDRVIIEEEIENVMGEFAIQNTELKLQKPAGEL